MPLTNAEKQARYRANRPFASGNGERRITSWVTTSVSLSLDHLAKHWGISQREVLEKLIESAAKAETEGMTEQALDHFLRMPVKPRTRKDKVTE